MGLNLIPANSPAILLRLGHHKRIGAFAKWTRAGSENQLWGDPGAKTVTEDSRETGDKGAYNWCKDTRPSIPNADFVDTESMHEWIFDL